MGEAELRAAIVEPARHAGVVVDPDLVERLLRQMGVSGAGARPDAGALPLLYGMAEEIVTDVTPRAEEPAEPPVARPASGRRRSRLHDAVGFAPRS